MIEPVLPTGECAYFARKGFFRPLVRRSGKNAVITKVFAVDRLCGQGMDGTTLKGEIGNDQKRKTLYE